ncbi:UNVERIFIED_CONTAM: putative S-adenosylmethionine-dependent methyltransferase [Sesamum latifolium]|uniref:S-adenosylmethionine-dependent methyltransferase n=1 Tax=Sesamum latifolium TaxID=2727402 RepID=A0AAW2WUS6_9LAMI
MSKTPPTRLWLLNWPQLFPSHADRHSSYLPKACFRRTHHSQIPELFVVFNDVITNVFNTIFSSLPPSRNYNAIGVPGDFHGRLLPESSLHFAYFLGHSIGLRRCQRRWRKAVLRLGTKGKFCTQDRKEVRDAYLNPYAKDIEAFLEARAVEMVSGGLMALLILEFLPFGTLRLNTLSLLVSPFWHLASWTWPGRAVCEGLLTDHFGSDINDELFALFMEKLAASPVFLNPNNDKSIVILVVLKRSSD